MGAVIINSPESASRAASRQAAAEAESLALDQWRGLALILVLISHGFYYTGRVNGAGRIGVNIFFFISGILVYRSLRSGSAKGHLAKEFWRRRLRRLYPALMAYLLIMLVVVAFAQHLPHLPARSDLGSYLLRLVPAATYTANYLQNPPESLNHLWSLSCEAQFYFLAPALFLLGNGSRRRRWLVFGGFTLLCAVWGCLGPLFAADYETIKYHFEVASWPMALGFFCESVKDRFLAFPRAWVRRANALGLMLLAASIILMLVSSHAKMFAIGTGALLLAPCFLAYLFGVAAAGPAGRGLAWIGKRTYSIYLWQQPLTLCGFLPTVLHPAGALASIAVGAASFELFEKRFLSASRGRVASRPANEGTGASNRRGVQ